MCQSAGGYVHKERMYRNHNRHHTRVGAFSATQDVGTYRQVRPLFQPTGGYFHKERIYPYHHHRPHIRAGDVSRDAGFHPFNGYNPINNRR